MQRWIVGRAALARGSRTTIELPGSGPMLEHRNGLADYLNRRKITTSTMPMITSHHHHGNPQKNQVVLVSAPFSVIICHPRAHMGMLEPPFDEQKHDKQDEQRQ